ncbi:MAG: hypothetical protein ACSLFK_09930 [Gemmatimonadaceae bacterium]
MPRIFPAYAALLLMACGPATNAAGDSASHATAADSSFSAMDHRHGDMIGVDPSSLAHTFVPTPDGGDIILERRSGDTIAVSLIRGHLEQIAAAFSTGDFSAPAMVHEKEADGADVMIRKAGVITYSVEERANGASLQIRTRDPEALDAIHNFIAFQTREHRTG